jgi:hypothetical protein
MNSSESVMKLGIRWSFRRRKEGLVCRDPSMIRGESQVFFNGESRSIRWEVESAVPESSKSTSKFDRRRNKEDEEDEKEEICEFFSDKNMGLPTQKTRKDINTSQTGKSGGYGNYQNQNQKGYQANHLKNTFVEDRDSCNKECGATNTQTESEKNSHNNNRQNESKANKTVEGGE